MKKKITPFRLLLVVFLVLLLTIWILLALGTPDDVAPDEIYHFRVTSYYIEESLDPFIDSQTSHYDLGDLTRIRSYLYPFLLSWVLRATPFIEDQLMTLRTVNILLSVVNLFLVYKVFTLLVKRKSAVLSGLILLYSLLMYLFLGAFINYDNLALTFALLMAIVYLRFTKDPQLKYLLIFLILSVVGSLVKYTLLPLSAIYLLLYLLNKNTYKCLLPIKQIPQLLWSNKLLTIILILSSILFIERYGYNLYEYRTTQPSCFTLYTTEQCEQNGLLKRNNDLANSEVGELVPIHIYVKEWSIMMYHGAVGVLGHKHMLAWDKAILFLGPILLIPIVGFIKLLKSKEYKSIRFDLLSIVFLYALILLFGVNYPAYRGNGVLVIGVQGRYLFPVIPILVGLLMYYTERVLKGKWFYLYLGFVSLFFLINIYYLFNNIEVLWGG